MIRRKSLRAILVSIGVIAILIFAFLRSSPRPGWTTVCEWHSKSTIPGYSDALQIYRSWLSANLFRECDAPVFVKDVPASVKVGESRVNTKWYQSQKYPDVYVATSADLENVRANIVVSVQDPFFSFRTTEEELKTYTDEVSKELHQLWNPNFGVQ